MSDASGAVIVSTSPKNDRATAAFAGVMMRSKVYLTSALVSASPLWNFTPLRILTVTVFPSDEMVGIALRVKPVFQAATLSVSVASTAIVLPDAIAGSACVGSAPETV